MKKVISTMRQQARAAVRRSLSLILGYQVCYAGNKRMATRYCLTWEEAMRWMALVPPAFGDVFVIRGAKPVAHRISGRAA